MSDASREQLRAELLFRIPRWYSPWPHLAFPAVAGIAISAFALSRIGNLRGWQLAFAPLLLLIGNIAEWHTHRDILHRRTWPIEVLYTRHTLQHHAVYRADDMFIRDWRELKLVLLPAYGVLALLAVTSPATIVLVLVGQKNLAALWVTSVTLYILSYEWLHLAYHMPAEGPVGRWRITKWLRRHHQRHHSPELMQRWNFNVTVPLWDHVRGTVYRPPE
jgi:hypothetical protein